MARLGSALARAALSLVLTVGLVPAVAFADSDDAAASDAYTFQVWSENSLTGGSGEIVVDEAAGLSLLSDDGVDLASAEILEYEDAVKAVTEALGSRAAQVSVTIEEGEDWGSQWEAIVEDALAEDGNPSHGDYLRYVLGGVGARVSGWPVTGGRYNATYDYSFEYMTTAAQEQELNAKVDEVLADLDLDSKTNYQKAEAIYRFICANVAYDYANLNDDSYKLKYTAYAALINGTSVCQGYASLFYLMAGKAGLPCRIISGTGNGGAHSWNIVQMDDGLWYNVDVTWDEDRLTWDYFLKSDSDFGNHVRSGAEADDMYRENYSSEAFYAAYPMGVTSYDPSAAGGEGGEGDEGNSGGDAEQRLIYEADGFYIENQTYTGEAIEPKLSLTYNGVALVEGVDYEVTYENNVEVGVATVWVRGIGGFEGAVQTEFLIVPPEDFAVEVGDLDLYGLDGTVRSLAQDYAGTNYVIIGGRSTCWNTQNAVANILSLLEESAYNDVHLIVLDVDGDAEAFAEGFSALHGGNAYFASSDDWGYGSWLWSMLGQVDYEAASSGSITLPFAFAVGEEGTVLWGGAGPFDERLTLSEAFGIDDPQAGFDPEPEPGVGSDTVDVAITAYVDQEEARKLLDMVNAARAEVDAAPLRWDEELEEAALQRASELAVLFDHTRPDGSSCFTAFPPCGAAGENIAAGYGSAAAVNLGWTNSAGHYANMIGSAYTSMAAACVLVDGYPYWVELFTDRVGSDELGQPLVSDGVVFPVSVPADGLTLALEVPWQMIVGDTVDLFELVTAGGLQLASGSGLVWESSDPSIMQVDSNGQAVALSPGTVQVTVSLAGNPSASATAECAVAPLSIDGATIGGMSDQTYTGAPIEPKPEVTLAGKTLVPGTDYVLSYRNNLNAGEAAVVVSGIGNYEGIVEAAFDIVPVTLVATYAGESVAWGEAPSLSVSVEGFVGGESAHTAAGYAAPAVVLPSLEPGRSYELAPAGGAADNYVFEYVAGALSVGKCDIASAEGLEIADQRHSGLAIEPQIELSVGGVALVEGVDYEVAYVNNVEAGTATAIVTGKGGFTGEARVEFEIVDAPSDLWKRFPDVAADVKKADGPENVWYVADGWLDYVVEAGLMTGYASDGFFGRYDLIPRCQVATILYRAECAKDPSLVGRYGSTTDGKAYAQSCFFGDMRANQYYTAAINWAKDAGVMTGDAGTGYKTVRPDDPVSRQELCLMLARYANGGAVPETALDPAKAEGILGMDEVAGWARDGVNWAVNNGVIGGVDNHDGTYSMNPNDTTWRAAAAKMFTVVMRDLL